MRSQRVAMDGTMRHRLEREALSRVAFGLAGQSGRRVRRRVNGMQAGNGHVRIPLRTGDLPMPEDLLHMADVRPVVEHCRRHRVPEQVAGAALGDAGPLEVIAHAPAQPIRREGPQLAMRALCVMGDQEVSLTPFFSPFLRELLQANDPIFLASPLPLEQLAAIHYMTRFSAMNHRSSLFQQVD